MKDHRVRVAVVECYDAFLGKYTFMTDFVLQKLH